MPEPTFITEGDFAEYLRRWDEGLLDFDQIPTLIDSDIHPRGVRGWFTVRRESDDA